MTLTGVPETALWTLYHRALAAGQGVLEDPKAIELVDRIDHPFRERFGGGELAPWQGLRVRAFDREIRRVLREEPDATVVALGEGLETQFWRVDNGRMRWVTVDLPESVALRERLLPAGERQTTIAASALDVDRWIATRPSLITAQGLLM
jgi:O-methyltransferase involved in polyketide biosynthesis